MTTLKLDWCSIEAAKYACEKWHYSGSIPPPPRVCIGVWEDEKFVGVVIFARGASSNLLKPYGLEPTEGAELVRIALTKHVTPVSRILSIAVKMLRKKEQGLRLLVSFADPAQGHHGGVYKGAGWTYTGTSSPSKQYRDQTGRLWHERQVSEKGWNTQFGVRRKVPKRSECEAIQIPGKHRYLLPLDGDMRKLVENLRKTAPTAVDTGTPCVSSDPATRPANQPEKGGSTPTLTLLQAEMPAATDSSLRSSTTLPEPGNLREADDLSPRATIPDDRLIKTRCTASAQPQLSLDRPDRTVHHDRTSANTAARRSSSPSLR